MGMLEAALYGVPISFFGRFATAHLGPFVLLVGLAAWAAVGVWVMRRADAKFRKGAAGRMPSGDVARVVDDLQTTVLKYVGLASLVLLAFALLPALFSPLLPGVGVWVPLGGLGFFSFVMLLGFTALYAAGGMVPALRKSLYPAYPGFVASLFFALAMVAFFVSYILAV